MFPLIILFLKNEYGGTKLPDAVSVDGTVAPAPKATFPEASSCIFVVVEAPFLMFVTLSCDI
jgi:hypothetical protein